MINNCDFEIKIVGTKESCLQAQSYFEDKKDGQRVAVNSCNYIKEDCKIENIPDSNLFVYTFVGTCKWSIELRTKTSNNFITLIQLAKLLKVKMEYFLQECSFEFAGHVVIDPNGFVTFDERVGYYEVDAKDFDTFDDFLNEYRKQIATCVTNNDVDYLQEQFTEAKSNEDNCWFSFGGLDNDYTIY